MMVLLCACIGLRDTCFLCVAAQSWALQPNNNGQLASFFSPASLPAPSTSFIMTEGALGQATRGSSYMDWYAERLSGYFVPPYNATYTFYLAGDDWVDLALSQSESAAGLTVIASNPSWNDMAFPFYRSTSQISTPFPLIGGKRYFMRARHTEGNGVDWLRVAVRITDAPAAGMFAASQFLGHICVPVQFGDVG